MYLLDTNHYSKLLANHHSIVNKLRELNQYGNFKIAISSVTEAEIRFMAENSKQKKENMDRIERALRGTKIHTPDSETSRIYAQFRFQVLSKFGPKNGEKRKKFSLSQIGITDHDLWIAATAKQHDLILVSSDGDFKRMNEAGCNLLLDQWWFPDNQKIPNPESQLFLESPRIQAE